MHRNGLGMSIIGFAQSALQRRTACPALDTGGLLAWRTLGAITIYAPPHRLKAQRNCDLWNSGRAFARGTGAAWGARSQLRPTHKAKCG